MHQWTHKLHRLMPQCLKWWAAKHLIWFIATCLFNLGALWGHITSTCVKKRDPIAPSAELQRSQRYCHWFIYSMSLMIHSVYNSASGISLCSNFKFLHSSYVQGVIQLNCFIIRAERWFVLLCLQLNTTFKAESSNCLTLVKKEHMADFDELLKIIYRKTLNYFTVEIK